VWFALRQNTGATLGFLSGHSQLVGALSLIVVGALAIFGLGSGAGGSLGAIALGAIAGGALGNLVDRARMGAVTDFLEVHLWPTDFNLADAAIRLGVVLFLLSLLLPAVRRPARSHA
jgi:signal peptidase II